MQYIEKVRGYAEQMPINEAVERAITECIGEGILAEFLKRNRAEAIKVSIYEYNEELHLATVRQEGYEDGLVEGLERGITQGITPDVCRWKSGRGRGLYVLGVYTGKLYGVCESQ